MTKASRWWVVGDAIAVLAILASGCSQGTREREIDSLLAEPELAAPDRLRAAGLVPVIIRPSRPYFHSASSSGRLPRYFPGSGVAGPGLPHQRSAAAGGDPRPEIEAALADYLRDFNHHDAAQVAAHWSEQAENVDLDSGTATVGRDAVHGVFTALFEQDPQATIDIGVESVRPVRRDVAVVDGTSTVRFGDGTRAGSRFSAVMVRQGGGWLLDSVREAALPADEGDAPPLSALSWLVGSWHGVGAGAATTRCSWTGGEAFLVRTHVVAEPAAAEAGPDAAGVPALLPADDSGREVTEIIGWDPDSRLIRSWIFTSTGRFAEGSWVRDGARWRVRVEGRGGDAGRAAESVIARRGVDEVTVEGLRDGLGGDLAPVGTFIRSGR